MPDTNHLADALRKIIHVRDCLAEGEKWSDLTGCGPEVAFDDWAADLAEKALNDSGVETPATNG